jgi:glycosyltransferase involved in cell wall biosynthesis
VRFHGRLPAADVAQLMKEARALVFPSRWYEGQPMVVLEAFAAGLPVLASSLGGMPELVAPLGADWLVPAEGEWSDAMGTLTDDTAVDAAGRQARDLYELRFTPDHALAELERCYRDAARRGARC